MAFFNLTVTSTGPVASPFAAPMPPVASLFAAPAPTHKHVDAPLSAQLRAWIPGALAIKEEGNALFKANDYSSTVAQYSQVIIKQGGGGGPRVI